MATSLAVRHKKIVNLCLLFLRVISKGRYIWLKKVLDKTSKHLSQPFSKLSKLLIKMIKILSKSKNQIQELKARSKRIWTVRRWIKGSNKRINNSNLKKLKVRITSLVLKS